VAAQAIDPRHLWIRFAPRAWPGPPGWWTDLAAATLGESDPRAAVAIEPPFDDLLYLPAVSPELEGQRLALARTHLALGTPVLLQRMPGEPPPEGGAAAVYDLLPALLAGEVEALGSVPAGAAAVWPLIAGLTDDPGAWQAGCERLAAAGAAAVQAVELSLSPRRRRRLAEGRGPEVFHALFHRPPRPEREFARCAHRFGLTPFLPRPLPRPPLAGAANRRLAAELLLLAELWLALGRPVGQGLAWSRAGRWVDESTYDVEALAREGNLGVVEALDPNSRAAIEERARSGRLALLAELLAEYVS
jgi:hypothetical protein